jgi:hypothetical protein
MLGDPISTRLMTFEPVKRLPRRLSLTMIKIVLITTISFETPSQ